MVLVGPGDEPDHDQHENERRNRPHEGDIDVVFVADHSLEQVLHEEIPDEEGCAKRNRHLGNTGLHDGRHEGEQREEQHDEGSDANTCPARDLAGFLVDLALLVFDGIETIPRAVLVELIERNAGEKLNRALVIELVALDEGTSVLLDRGGHEEGEQHEDDRESRYGDQDRHVELDERTLGLGCWLMEVEWVHVSSLFRGPAEGYFVWTGILSYIFQDRFTEPLPGAYSDQHCK